MAGEELSDSEDLPEWVRETGELISTQAQRILDTGNRYLSDRSSRPSIFSLEAVAREVGRVAAPLARASGRSVLVDVVTSVMVEAAEDDIHRVLINLVQNGLRHTRPGTVVVLRVGRTEEGQGFCQVIDDGDGVPEDILPHIFERGARSNSGGHGLGLAIAKRLSRAWGGGLSVCNLERKGACFTLTLPEVEAADL